MWLDDAGRLETTYRVNRARSYLSANLFPLYVRAGLGGQRAWWGPGSFSLPPLPALPCGGGALVEELDGQIVGVAEH